jgi:hypothetical protein
LQANEKQIRDLVDVVFYLQDEILKLAPEPKEKEQEPPAETAKPKTGHPRRK